MYVVLLSYEKSFFFEEKGGWELKELYEIGIVFRGFVLITHTFRELPQQQNKGPNKDLRGAFISAINSFADNLFKNNSLEYLESGNILFIFRVGELLPMDGFQNEPVILYGLADKKRKSDKIVKKFIEKVKPIITLFIHQFNGKDFTELNQFEPFADEIPKFFEK